jgi:F-box-like
MLYHGNSFLNYDLWMNITSYLQVQDVLNVSMACRAWYRQLAHQSLWEKVYTSILPGYPTDHFRTNHDISICARPEFVSLDGNGPVMLNDWYKTSWKQRSVYLAHIIRVQSTVISTMRQKTKTFLDIPSQPLHDVERINRFERTYGATFPIDFVIFAIYFAHHLRVDQFNRHEPSMGLVSGECFENPHLWKYWADKFNFAALDLGHSEPIMMEGYGLLQDQAFRNMMIFPFSQLTKCDELNKAQFLGMSLSKDNSFPPMRPKDGRLPILPDDSNLEDASGFVYRASFTALQEKTYGLEALCESFTDYLIQYTGVVLEYGDVPQYGRVGFVDLMIGLPREHRPKVSILLPHALDWDIGSYLPTEFTRMDSNIPVFTSLEHQINCSKSMAVDSVDNFDHAAESPVAVPPRHLFMAAKDKCRRNKPHSRHDVAPKPNIMKLADFGIGQYPPVNTIRLPSDVYQGLMEQAEEWIATSGCKCNTSLEIFTLY